ncbi:molybdopterin-dependent oxidoreductase [Variovorax sp. IB41]|uniref:molybdopterin-dependent oxidoreductase n=1 Tax=Variovorax sp. IB41 TaxID=2779370 RepID=UPI0018E8F4D1|nr:molybdopterin-dependent oxidoreductase [Variovorax sp. IB41]MBJ2154727.1 molybdopterin-dependent oxidoreductase [Variovorax sp. IB41]
MTTAANRTIQTASHWGVYSVEVSASGEIGPTVPFANDPAPTALIRSLPDMVRSPLRIDRPYVRSGYLKNRERSAQGRGSEAFVPVSWDTALDLIVDGMQRIKSEHGNESIYGGSYGWASAGRLHHSPSVLKRFLGLFGGYVDKRGNHSFGAALGVMPYVTGDNDITAMVMPWPSIVAHSELVVMFGGAHTKNMQIDAGGAVTHDNARWIERAAASRVRFVNISPSRSDMTEGLEADWIPIRPNTDVAMMLGMAHSLVAHGLHDAGFLATHCEGYGAFERYLLGQDDGVAKSAAWASAITGVPARTIEDLALRMARCRTLVTTTWSIQRADHGEQPVWATVALASMLGQIGLPGGGFSLGFGAVNGITTSRPDGIPRPTLSLGKNPVRSFVPVGRVADMLLNPGSELEFNGATIRMPDIRLIYSVGGNPFHHNTHLNRFVQAWRKPEMVVVHEPWWNPPAKYADIVLPATTTMERNDILATDLQRHYIAMRQVIDPVGGARNDMDIFADLSERLGFRQAYTEGRDEMGWLRHMYVQARERAFALGFSPPAFDEFWEAGSYEFPMAAEPPLFLSAFRGDPVANRLATPSGKIELFSRRIEAFGYDDCPPHPAWLEPAEWLGGESAARFPFHLLSNQPKGRLHSQMDAGAVSRATKVDGREPLALHASDAQRCGIVAGDVVKVFNDRGAFLASAVISCDLMPGVLQVATGAWFDPEDPAAPCSVEKHGNPNVVTMDKGTSRLTQSSVAQTVLVQIEKCVDPPRVSAFDLPAIEPAPAQAAALTPASATGGITG